MFRWLRQHRKPVGAASSQVAASVQDAYARAQAGDLDGAERVLRQALASNPIDVHALTGLGNVLAARGLPGEGLQHLRQALDVDPSLALARTNAVQCLRALGQLDAAIDECHALLARDPAGPGVSLLARCLDQAGRIAEAEIAYLSALDVTPADPALWCDYGLLLKGADRPDEAEKAFRQALELDPQYPPALNNLGLLFAAAHRLDLAKEILERAAALPYAPPYVWANLAVVSRYRNRIGEALAYFDRALAAGLRDPDVLVSRAVTLLLAGSLREGFAEYEHRFRTRSYLGMNTRGLGEPWRGEPLVGRRIVLRPEQGLGDTLQFVRFVRRLTALGGQVIVGAQAPLVRLLSASLPATVLAPGATVEGDCHCAMMSLPHLLGDSAVDDPWDGPYVQAVSNARIATAMAGLARPRVGLAWAGNPLHPDDDTRSLPFAALAPLLEVPGVSFCALQFGAAAAQAKPPPAGVSWTDLTPLISDFADTAAALAELDLLITVDTSIAHLAGAMGLPAWVLLPFSPDWRWQLEREDTRWYPSLRLLRQDTTGEWSPVVREAALRLAAIVAP